MTIILYIMGGIISIFMDVAGIVTDLIDASLPTDQFTEALTYFYMPILQFRGYWNIDVLLDVQVWLLTFLFFFVLYLGIKFLLAHAPGGTHNSVTLFRHEELAQQRLHNLRTKGQYRL